LIRDQTDRDAIASSMLRYRDERGTAWANLVDRLSLDPEHRRSTTMKTNTTATVLFILVPHQS